jgi:flagellar motor switch protein FliN/FliY
MQEDTENQSSEGQENTETETGLSDAQEVDGKISEEGGAENKSLDLILDIPLTVTVELGRSKMLINDLLQLGQGSVVELTKLVGEPLEVLINQKLVARGEVVVVNEKFGVRLTDIISPMERVQSLG